MAIISLDAQQIESLNQEIIALDNQLLQNYLPGLESELNAINGNVKGDEINPIINTILTQFQGVKSSLSTKMPKLEGFLEQQLKSYTQTEEELEQELTVVMNRMGLLADRVNRGKFGTTPNGNGLENPNVVETTKVTGNSSEQAEDATENNGSGLAGKVASGAATGAVLGGVGIATGVATTMLVGTKAGAALGAVGGPAGVAIGAVAGAAIGAATPLVINGAAKLIEVGGKTITSVGSWLDSIY